MLANCLGGRGGFPNSGSGGLGESAADPKIVLARSVDKEKVAAAVHCQQGRDKSIKLKVI